MRVNQLMALAFLDETNKIAADIRVPINQISLEDAVELLEKSGSTRYSREAAKAVSSGDMGTFNQIANAHQQLGLGNRTVKELGGGAEAGAFLNLGRAQGQTGGPNYHVEKFYNPESGISRGDHTRQLVEMKKNFTDTARSLSPEARNIVPEMYGHESKNIGAPTQRTRSTHEFVPGMQSMRTMDNRGEQLDQIEKHVISPMKMRGMSMGDTMREDVDRHGDPTRKVNFGNVVSSPQGPKVVDFLPHQQGTSYIPGQSFGTYAPDNKDRLEMSPRQAKAEYFNPKAQVTPAEAPMQAKAKTMWNVAGQVPDFEVNAVPFHQRTQQQQAQLQAAATPRANNTASRDAFAPTVTPRSVNTPAPASAQSAAQSAPTTNLRRPTPALAAPSPQPAPQPMQSAPTRNLRTPAPAATSVPTSSAGTATSVPTMRTPAPKPAFAPPKPAMHMPTMRPMTLHR